MLDKDDIQAIGEIMDTKLAQQKSETIQDVTGMLAQQKSETMEMFAQQKSETKEMLAQQKTETMEMFAQQKTETMEMFAQQKTETMEMFAQQRSETMEMFAQQRSEIMQGVSVLMESKFTPQFNLLAEGQQMIIDKLIPISRVEKLEEDVTILKIAVRQLSEDFQQFRKLN